MVFVFVDPPTHGLAIFLVQVFITLLVCRLMGKVLSYLKQPPVVGEIIGGIILGPSVLGQSQAFMDNIWPQTAAVRSVDTFGVVSNMGLIFFMFIMGMELDPELLRRQWRSSVPIASCAIAFPFLIGAVNSFWLMKINEETLPGVNQTAFILFSGAGMSFTAFPVLASILCATKLLNTPIGIQAMSCAAIDDIMAWCVLAIASSFSKDSSAKDGGWTCMLAVLFILSMFYIVRPALHFVHRYFLDRNDELNQFFICIVFLMLLTGSFVAEVIGIHAFFGAFISGIIMPKEGQVVHTLFPKLELISKEFLLPLYFASSGIKTNVGSLNSGRLWGYTFVVIILATLAKFLPSVLMGKLCTKRDWRFCITLGVLMNTRGLVELIALNVGRDLGILSPQLFTMMVLMAIATTVCTTPLLYFIYQRKYNADLEVDAAFHLERIKHVGEELAHGVGPTDQLVVQFVDPKASGSTTGAGEGHVPLYAEASGGGDLERGMAGSAEPSCEGSDGRVVCLVLSVPLSANAHVGDPDALSINEPPSAVRARRLSRGPSFHSRTGMSPNPSQHIHERAVLAPIMPQSHPYPPDEISPVKLHMEEGVPAPSSVAAAPSASETIALTSVHADQLSLVRDGSPSQNEVESEGRAPTIHE